MTKEEALATCWAARDGLLPMDIAKQIATTFGYNGKLPFKDTIQLRSEGVFLEEKSPNLEAGQGILYTQSLPEGVLTCDLLETMTNVGPPKIWPPLTDIKSVLNWRTQRALWEGAKWKPEAPGWIYYK